MRRYQFRLAQVQRVRQVQEDLAAATLGAAQRAESSAAAAEQARRAAVASRLRPTGHRDGAQLLAERAVWDAELADLARRSGERTAARDHTAAERAAWLVASRRVRALGLLDDRRREEHRIELDRAEAARVDDLVASRYRRQTGEASR